MKYSPPQNNLGGALSAALHQSNTLNERLKQLNNQQYQYVQQSQQYDMDMRFEDHQQRNDEFNKQL